MFITVSQSPQWHASFVQPLVQNPKTLNFKEKQQIFFNLHFSHCNQQMFDLVCKKKLLKPLIHCLLVCLFQGTSNSGGSPLIIFYPFTAKVIWYCRYVCSLTNSIF